MPLLFLGALFFILFLHVYLTPPWVNLWFPICLRLLPDLFISKHNQFMNTWSLSLRFHTTSSHFFYRHSFIFFFSLSDRLTFLLKFVKEKPFRWKKKISLVKIELVRLRKISDDYNLHIISNSQRITKKVFHLHVYYLRYRCHYWY